MILKALALFTLLAAGPTWDVSQPRGKVREIDFTTREGTWMSVDLSPDGKWIVFDLLGHVYRLPASGGEAECLTQSSGVALNIHPRFSPDGKRIAFVSDRAGHPHLWIMNADGSNPRRVPTDPRYRLLQPAWSADGKHLFARRGDGLFRIPLDGVEAKEELLVEGTAEWPSPSRDGRFLYFYALTPLEDSNEIRGDLLDGRRLRRLELATGKAEDVPVAALPGGAIAPEISPDGRRLAFVRRVQGGTTTWRGHAYAARTALRVRDLETGDERVVLEPAETDLSTLFDGRRMREMPGYAWSADGSSILLSQGGQIRRLRVSDGHVETVPFTARVRRTISQQADATHRISDGPLRVRMLRWHSASPDGSRLAFQALNKIWVTGAEDDGPRRLTPEGFTAPEWTPSWSPDGRWIAFTTWDRPGRGHVWKVPADGGEPVRLTGQAGEYLHPVWTPDGRELLIVRGIHEAAAITWADNTGYELALLPVGGGEPKTVTRASRPMFVYEPYSHRREIVRPSFGPEGRIYFPEHREEDGWFLTDLVSVNRDGGDRRVHATFRNADEVTPSPDGRWLAWEEGDEVFVQAFPQSGPDGKPPFLDYEAEGFAGRRLTTDGGLSPRWLDATTLGIGDGDRFYLCRNPPDCKLEAREVRLESPRARARGNVALTGARLVTLEGRKVIEKGTVVVRDGRISCLGDCDVRGVDRVLDAAGTTVIPGFIDMHAHHNEGQAEIIPWRNYEAATYLAYGVTTTFDPDSGSQNTFSSSETVETGGMAGPRIFTSGDPVFYDDGPNWLEVKTRDDARSRVQRLAAWGAPTIKEYMLRRREQRQWLMEAAREAGVRVTSEGTSYEDVLTRVMDGGTGVEHGFGFAPQYGDVGLFLGQAGYFYSPTLGISGPGPSNKELFLSRLAPDDERKLRRWLPPSYLLTQLAKPEARPEAAYGFPLMAEGMADVIAAGGGGAIGSHGELHGLASHWEVWMAASALGPHGALELASLQGARFLGTDRDLGSLAVGKLADLIVLEKNPLEDIRNTTSLRWVMKGGTLYDAESLDELWPEARKFGRFPWSP
ncbi:MAG TPA: amidohydrolase family protein [Thermoanaerobaculia bacterium]|nr:amidohydrolase family protein [Thermoanaerobaculia bacterium]